MIGRCVANRPYAYVPFKGNTNNESVNTISTTANSITSTTGEFGETNGAYEFNSITDYLQLTGISNTVASYINAGATIMHSIYFNSLTGGAMVTQSFIPTPETNGYQMFVRSTNSGSIVMTRVSSALYLNDYYNTVSTGAWYHQVAIFRENGPNINFEYYSNGIKETVDSGTEVSPKLLTTGNQQYRIGARASDNSNGFIGKIHSVRIYSQAFTAGMIKILKNEKGRIRA